MPFAISKQLIHTPYMYVLYTNEVMCQRAKAIMWQHRVFVGIAAAC